MTFLAPCPPAPGAIPSTGGFCQGWQRIPVRLQVHQSQGPPDIPGVSSRQLKQLKRRLSLVVGGNIRQPRARANVCLGRLPRGCGATLHGNPPVLAGDASQGAKVVLAGKISLSSWQPTPRWDWGWICLDPRAYIECSPRFKKVFCLLLKPLTCSYIMHHNAWTD